MRRRIALNSPGIREMSGKMSHDVETINLASMPAPEIRAIVDWLIDGARSAPLPQDVLSQLCKRIVACGIPLWRVAVFVNTLHPQIIGRRFIWRRRPATR
jgi:hypothetical protein